MGNEASLQSGVTLPPIENNLHVQWQSVITTNSPSAREGAVSGVIGDKIYVFGGGASDPETGPVQFNDLWSFDKTTNAWTAHTQFASGSLPKSRTGAASCVINQNLYIFGGLSESEGWINDLHIYNPSTNSWTNNITTTGQVPSPRDKHNSVALGNFIYVFGGFGPQTPVEPEPQVEDDDEEEDVPATFGWFNDLYTLDTGNEFMVTNVWTRLQVEGVVPTPRAAFGMVLVSKTIVIFGGRDNSQRQNDLYTFDTETKEWKRVTPTGSSPVNRSFHTMVVVGDKLVVFGGLSQANTHLNDLHIFDTVLNAWVQPKTVDGNIPTRGFHSCNQIGTQLFIFGGGSDYDSLIQENKTYLNDTFSLDVTPIISAKFELAKSE